MCSFYPLQNPNEYKNKAERAADFKISNEGSSKFDANHVTIDEGEVKIIEKGKIVTYPNVNSCFSLTLLLEDGSSIGAHLVTKSNDVLELNTRSEKGILESDKILPEIAKKLGDKKINEIILAGSLAESQYIETYDELGKKRGSYYTDAWSGKDLVPELQNCEADFTGGQMLTALVFLYFQKNLKEFGENEKGTLASSYTTDETALIKIENNSPSASKVSIQSQKEFDAGQVDKEMDSRLFKKSVVVENNETFELWLGISDLIENKGWREEI